MEIQGGQDGNESRRHANSKQQNDGTDVQISQEKVKFYYGVADKPPIHLTLFFGLQQSLLSLSLNLTVTLLIADAACARADELLKAKLLGTTLVISGASTILMVMVGSRLPIYQGPATAFVIPLVALRTLDNWKCPASQVNGIMFVKL